MRPWCRIVCWNRERPGMVSGLFFGEAFEMPQCQLGPTQRVTQEVEHTSRWFGSVDPSRGRGSRIGYSTVCTRLDLARQELAQRL